MSGLKLILAHFFGSIYFTNSGIRSFALITYFFILIVLIYIYIYILKLTLLLLYIS